MRQAEGDDSLGVGAQFLHAFQQGLDQVRPERVPGLRCVDYVVIFDEQDVKSLLREFQPDVHAKGTDYTPDTVPERDLAKLLGIRVAIVGDPKDHSTRDLLARLRSSPKPTDSAKPPDPPDSPKPADTPERADREDG